MAHDLEEFDAYIYSLDAKEVNKLQTNGLSYYEETFTTCAKFICQQDRDSFPKVQKCLLKHIFDKSYVRSMFASDLYMFVFRLVSPAHQSSMCQIVMNMCRLAPPDALAKGAALINRINNPVVNFKNPKYERILEFS
mgnify:CR=1 FL=1